MSILDKEFKTKKKKKKTLNKKKRPYSPRSEQLNYGKNNKQEPIPNYYRI